MAAGFGSLRAKYIEGGVITSAMSIFTSCLGGGDNVLRAWRWPHAWIMCRIPPHYALCTILDCSIAKWSEGGLWGWDTFRKNHSGRNINLCHCLQLVKIANRENTWKITFKSDSKSKDMILSLLPYHPTILGLQFIEEYTLTSTSVYISIQISLGTNKLPDLSFTKKEILL